MATLSFSACSDDIENNASISDPNRKLEAVTFLSHKGLPNVSADVELRQSSLTRYISLNLSRGTAEGATAQVEVVTDAADLIADYNMNNGTSYKEYPTDRVSLENNGELKIQPWRTVSEPLGVTFREEAGGTPLGEYILPIRVKGDGAGMIADKQILWFRISVDKKYTMAPRDVEPIACVQINGTNPLNAGLYTLRNSGEAFFSQVTLFAANINWDAMEKKAIVTFNENLTPLMENRNKYIKPLQDKGIKVTLSLLGNRDGVCFRNYTQQGALDFAKEICSVIEAYGLDGVFMDEEYMNYGSNNLPMANSTSWGYLCYYLKQLMPDKLVTIYNYDIGSDFKGSTMGQPTGTFVDHAVQYSSDSWQPNGYSSFNGMSKRQWGPWSAIIYDDYQSNNYGGARPKLSTLRNSTSLSRLEQIRDNYGAVFFYNLAAFCPDIASYMANALSSFGLNGFDANTRAYDYSDYFTEYAKVLFNGDEVFRDGEPIPNDYSPS
jgi:hypothetical protein